MSNPTTPATPAGWYPDPAGTPRSRWWDGTQWTDNFADPSGQVAQPPQPVYPQQYAGQQAAYGQQPYGQQGYAQQAYTPAAPLRAPEGTKPNTLWIWLYDAMLVLPIIAFAAWDISGWLLTSMTSTMQNPSDPYAALALYTDPGYLSIIAASFLYWAGTVVFALLDFRALKAAGVPNPFHWAWTFLNPIIYIIGRTVIVRRRTGGGLGPLWLFIGLYVLYIIIAFTKMFTAMNDLFSSIPGYMGSI